MDHSRVLDMKRKPAPPKRILHDLTEKRSWSQSDVVRRSGLSRAMVSTLFNGRRKSVNSSTVDALVLALGVTHAQLYGYDGQDVGRLLPDKNLDLYFSIGNALKAEFKGSSLREKLAEKNHEMILGRLKDAGVQDELKKYFTANQDVLRNLPLTCQSLFNKTTVVTLQKELKGRPLSVTTNAMECGTVAALLLAKEFLRQRDIELQVDFSRVHGGDLTRALNNEQESYDFAILGFSPMYLDLTIYVRKSNYVLLTPVHVASQHVYAASTDRDQLKLVYYLEGGSGELQKEWAEDGQGELGECKPSFEVLRDRRTFSVAKALERNEGVIAYSALGTTLEEEFGLKRVDGSSFDIHACLFAHQKRVGNNAALVKAFAVAFSRAYVACNFDEPKSRRLLWKDDLYPMLYASGAGIPFTR